MSLQLGVSYQGGEQEYVRVRRWPFSIGRNPGNDLCLNNSEFVSRRHAQLVKDAERVRLVTLGRNPTFLNGALVEPDTPVDVNPGDRIELPNYLIEIRSASRRAVTAQTINVETVSPKTVIIRRIASLLRTANWSTGAIADWLAEKNNREVVVCQHPLTLVLASGIQAEELERRLELFERLIDPLDPYSLTIDVTDPGACEEQSA